MNTDVPAVFRSRGLSYWLVASWSVFLLIGVSMLSVAPSTIADRVTGGVVTIVSVGLIGAALRRRVETDHSGFVIYFVRSRRVPWDRLEAVQVVRSGAGYGVKVQIVGDRFRRLLPVGSFGIRALREDSVVMRLAQVLDAHRRHES